MKIKTIVDEEYSEYEAFTCGECGKDVKAIVVFDYIEWDCTCCGTCLSCLAKATKGVFDGLCKVENSLSTT